MKAVGIVCELDIKNLPKVKTREGLSSYLLNTIRNKYENGNTSKTTRATGN